jgi:DNA-binding Xre family transcriptional regulator
VINTIKEFIERRGISVYRFRKDVGVAQSTAYDLVNNPDRIPNAEVLDKICTAYEVQPGEFIKWVPGSQRHTN